MERDRDRQTDRDGGTHRQTETDRQRRRDTETDRDGDRRAGKAGRVG